MAMRRASRQIEVFDISLMAVVTKAMGAFLVLMILLMPYYKSNPTYQAPVKDLSKELNDVQKQLDDMKRKLGSDNSDPAAMRQELDESRQQIAQAQKSMDKLSKQLDQAWSQYQQAKDENSRLQQQVATAQQQVAQAQSQSQAAQQQAAQAQADTSALSKTLNDAEPATKLTFSVLYKFNKICADTATIRWDIDSLGDSAQLPAVEMERTPDFVNRTNLIQQTYFNGFFVPGQDFVEGNTLNEFIVRADETKYRFLIYAARLPGKHIPAGCNVAFAFASNAKDQSDQMSYTTVPVPLDDLETTLLRVADFKASPTSFQNPTDGDVKALFAMLAKRKEMAAAEAAKNAPKGDTKSPAPSPLSH